jgi:hypothetical protein
VARALAPRPLRCPAAALSWLADPLAAGNPADMLMTNAAAAAFDAEPQLHRVRASTLVIGASGLRFLGSLPTARKDYGAVWEPGASLGSQRVQSRPDGAHCLRVLVLVGGSPFDYAGLGSTDGCAWHARCQGFESAWLHFMMSLQVRPLINGRLRPVGQGLGVPFPQLRSVIVAGRRGRG